MSLVIYPYSFLIQFCSLFSLLNTIGSSSFFVILLPKGPATRKYFFSLLIYIHLMNFSLYITQFFYILLFCFGLGSLIMKECLVINVYLDTAFAVFNRSYLVCFLGFLAIIFQQDFISLDQETSKYVVVNFQVIKIY